MTPAFARILLSSSAIVMAVLGLVASFLPHEVIRAVGASPAALPALLVQVTGALYLGFAFVNWTTRTNLTGGIYGRPVAIGNLMHFVVAGLALLKGTEAMTDRVLVWVFAALYATFAVGFALVTFRHPKVGHAEDQNAQDDAV